VSRHGAGQVSFWHGPLSLPVARWVTTRSTTPTGALTRTQSAVRTGPPSLMRSEPSTVSEVSTASRSCAGSLSHTMRYLPPQTVGSETRSAAMVVSLVSSVATIGGQWLAASCRVNSATRPGRSQRLLAGLQALPCSMFCVTTVTRGMFFATVVFPEVVAGVVGREADVPEEHPANNTSPTTKLVIPRPTRGTLMPGRAREARRSLRVSCGSVP
jgi:hypothetical protein